MAANLSRKIRERASITSACANTTVQQFGELWTSGQLYELHGEVRGLAPKASSKDDATRLAAHVYPYIGHVAVKDVTR